MTYADYTDDIALLANTPTQADYLLHSQDQAVEGIGLHVNVDKTEYMSFNQEWAISIPNDGPLKLVDKFTHFGSSFSFSESDVIIHLVKVWAAINRLSIIEQSNLPDKIKRDFFKVGPIQLYGYTTWTLTKSINEKNLMGTAQERYKLYWTNPGSSHLGKNSCTATYFPSLKPSK